MKKTKKKQVGTSTIVDVLKDFSLKKYMKHIEKTQPLLYEEIKGYSEDVQMAAMCKQICSRSDMLDTPAYKKASKWLVKHNMKRRFF